MQREDFPLMVTLLLPLTIGVLIIVTLPDLRASVTCSTPCKSGCETYCLTTDCWICSSSTCTADCFVSYDSGNQLSGQCECWDPKQKKCIPYNQWWRKIKYDCTYPRDYVDDSICIRKWFTEKGSSLSPWSMIKEDKSPSALCLTGAIE